MKYEAYIAIVNREHNSNVSSELKNAKLSFNFEYYVMRNMCIYIYNRIINQFYVMQTEF